MFWGSQENGDDESNPEEVVAPTTSKQADINVFTVASGHLYEVCPSIFVKDYLDPSLISAYLQS